MGAGSDDVYVVNARAYESKSTTLEVYETKYDEL